jgi:hypothetical protein
MAGRTLEGHSFNVDENCMLKIQFVKKARKKSGWYYSLKFNLSCLIQIQK